MNVQSLQGIASYGGNIDMSAKGFSVLSLQGIASYGKAKGAKLILRDVGGLSALDMQGIASYSPGNVTFVF